ncbi:MAG TPA: glycosyltransferase family 4 protein [Candidatus Saccharimonadales bacterium]|nr:glycosyltransferase family 4 protein [Candidatus Saccharimonadales bacterium]
MKKLKIALVFDDTLDNPDGVQQYTLALGRWLANTGHEVHYIVGETKRQDLPNVHSMARNLHVRFNQNRMSMPLPVSRRKVRELLEREQFDVLHVQVPYSPYLAARVIAATPPRTAVIGTFHIAPHSWVVSVANRLLGIWLRRNLRRFDRMLAVSKVAQAFAKKTFRIPSEIVPNTIDLAPFFAGKPFEKYKGMPTIMFLGRLVERKGCRYLLEAAALLRKTFKKPFRIVVCGGGPLEHELKLYVNAHGLADVVSFEGFISADDKPRYLASADIVTFPSTGGESFGIVILEAMAASKGVVLAGDNPGYAAVLAEHPEALFDPRSTKAFAELLHRYLQDAGARQRAHAWQADFVKQYDAPVVGAQILAIYNEALRQRQNVQ